MIKYKRYEIVDLRHSTQSWFELGARHLPRGTRAESTWQYVVAKLKKAAAGADPRDVSIALQMVLMLEGVECRSKSASPLFP